MPTEKPQRPRQLWLLPVSLIAVIVTALGGLLARAVYDEPVPPGAEPVLPTQSSMPPSAQPGPSTVEGTVDAVAHPLYRSVQSQLQKYFDAINTKDYERWADTVTAERLRTISEEKWLADYGTTRDGSIVVYRIEAGDEDTANVLLSFTSVQDPESAPTELPVGCIHWNVVWPFEREQGTWKQAAGPAGATPEHEAC